MTAITSRAPTTTISAPVARPEGYSTGDMILALFKEKVKDIAKAVGYLAFWVDKASPGLPAGVSKFSVFASRDVKNFISVTELPEKIHKCAVSVKEFGASLAARVAGKEDASWSKVGETARKALLTDTPGLINTLSDTFEFVKPYHKIPISKELTRWIGSVSYSATAINFSNELVENMQKIYVENKDRAIGDVEKTKTPLYVIRAVSAISYIALAAIGLYGIIAATAMAPWMFVACLTVSVTCSIGGFFYEKIYDPECKGLNLKPAVVIENVARQRAFEARTATAGAA